MKKHSRILVIVLSMALVVNVLPVQATPGTWTQHLYALNVSGESDGYSGKMVNNVAGGQWGANILTQTQYPAVSLAMGWDYFSGTEYCGYQTAVQNVQGSPRYINTSQTGSTIYLTKKTCTLPRYGSSNGKHIISAPGGTNYYDEWSHKDPLT